MHSGCGLRSQLSLESRVPPGRCSHRSFHYNRGPADHGIVARVGLIDEWHLDFRKSLASADIGKKGLSCSDGVCDNPISGKEAQGCAILTKDGFGNKCNFCDVNSCRTEICRSRMFSRKTSLHRRSRRSAYSGKTHLHASCNALGFSEPGVERRPFLPCGCRSPHCIPGFTGRKTMLRANGRLLSGARTIARKVLRRRGVFGRSCVGRQSRSTVAVERSASLHV